MADAIRQFGKDRIVLRAEFLDFGSVAQPGELSLATLEAVLPALRCWSHTAAGDVAVRMREAEVVLVNAQPLDAAAIAHATHLRGIGPTSTGTNHIDLDAARARGIAVINIVDYCTPSVAQHVFAVLLALTHHLVEYDRDLKAGLWQHAPLSVPDHPVRELGGLVLGIVGYGHLGRAVATLGRAFGMDVRIANRPGGEPERGRFDLADLLPVVDVLSLHCPLSPATRGLLGRAELARMKRDAIVINTARGALIDAQALADALRAGRLGGAGIDVLDEEPPLAGNPLLAPDLHQVIVTPHTAWAARESRQRGLDQLAGRIADWVAGGRGGRVV